MDEDSGAPLVVVGTQPANPGDDRRDGVRPLSGGNRRPELHERVAPRVALAVPGPAAAHRHLEFHHRLEPVDVGPVKQADLDQSHRPGRIATRTGA